MARVIATRPALVEGRTARRRGALVMLVAVVLLGAALRFYDLGTESYWLDEMTMVRVASGSLDSIIAMAAWGAGRPPVFVLLAHYWMAAFGTAEAITRALPALVGVASLVVMYIVGRDLFGRKAGLISAFLMAVSEFQIYHSQNFRYYGVFVLVTLLSFLFYTRALKDGRRADFLLYVVASILLYFTHSYGVFVIAAQNLYFFLRWLRQRQGLVGWVFWQALIAVVLAPGLTRAASAASIGAASVQQWIPDPQWWQPLVTLMKFVFPGRHYPSVMTFAIAGSLLVGGTLLAARWNGTERWRASLKELVATRGVAASQAPALALVMFWLLCPILIPLALSEVTGPMYIDRYTIAAAPALYMLLAVGIVAVRRVVPEVVALGLLVVLITPGLYEYYTTPVKEQWREAAAYLQENGRSGDMIVFAPDENGTVRDALFWYYRGGLPTCGIDVELRQETEIVAALANCTTGKDRFWLVFRGNPQRRTEYSGHLADFFFSGSHAEMPRLQGKEFKDVAVYLFASSTP